MAYDECDGAKRDRAGYEGERGYLAAAVTGVGQRPFAEVLALDEVVHLVTLPAPALLALLVLAPPEMSRTEER